MRDILFKAKRIDNGEWVEGYLFETREHAYIAYANQFDDDLFLSPHNIFIEVDANTICQYSGLTDKFTKSHKLKLLETFADDVLIGYKTFEVRKNNRGFQKGDTVKFNCVDSNGAEIPHLINTKTYRITYVLNGWGVENGYVVFGIQEVKEDETD